MCGRRLLLALVLATALAAVSGTGNFSTVLNGTQTSGSPPPSPPSPPAIQFGGISSHVPLPTVEALLNTTDEELLNSTANPYLAEGLANLTALAQLAQLEVPPCDAGSFPSGGSTSGAGPGDGKGGGGGGHPRGPTFLWLDWLKDGLSSILPWSRPGSFDPDLKAVARDRAYRDELLRQLPPQTYQVWTVQQAEGSPFATSPTATTTIAAHTSDASTAQGDAFEGATLAGPAESDVSSSSRTHLREADLDNNTDEPPAKRTRAAVAEVSPTSATQHRDLSQVYCCIASHT